MTAARFRIEAFTRALVGRGHEVEVIAPIPNHPEGVVHPDFEGRRFVRTHVEGAAVEYVWTYVSREKTMARRLAFYGSYFSVASLVGSAHGRPDVILATSPPLTVAAAGATVAWRHRVPWVFDVRDLWPLAAELIGELTNPRAVAAAERLERRLYRSADAIVAVTRAFERHIAPLTDDPGKIVLIRNGTGDAWLTAPADPPTREELGLPSDRFVWTYAGNLGPSRRLDVAVEAAAQLGEEFELAIVGDGGAREGLEAAARDAAGARVSFHGLLAPERAAAVLRCSDVQFVPQRRGLGDFVPSKLFDCAATGKPLVVMADGETVDVAKESGAALCVEPEDVDGLVAALRELRDRPELAAELGSAGTRFAERHSRTRQAEDLVDLLERLAGGGEA